MDRLAAPPEHVYQAPDLRRHTVTSAYLEADGLVKRYRDVTAVDGISFAVDPGEMFGLLGPNGAGKTTAISMIATLLKPDAGRVRVGGYDVTREPARVRPLLGFVPQETGVHAVLTARENLEYFAGIQGVRGRDLKLRIAEALAIAGLEPYADKPLVRFFSGGMRRRLNLAAGLVHRPRLLLLDEPTVGVDPQSRNLILESIRRFSSEEGMTVLYTTHYIEEAEHICDRVAIMDHGRILACDEVERLVASAAGTTIEVTLLDPFPDFARALSSAAGIASVTGDDETSYMVEAADQGQGLAALVGLAGRDGLTFRELRIVPPSLERVFLSLTGHELRDETGQ